MVRSSALVILFVVAGVSRAEVRAVRAPDNGQVPEAVIDAKGILHLAYGSGQSGNAFYVRSTDGGKTFTKPVRINQRADTVTCGMERGPRLALGKDGVIHSCWDGFYKKGGGAWYTRSTDGGKTFEPERELQDPKYGLDNIALAADDAGNVIVLWTGGFPGAPKDAQSDTAAPIVLARSTDNGKTFAKNELLKSNHAASSFACGCCRLEAVLGGDGNLYVGFRGGYKGLRDPWLLVGKKTENDFKCVLVHEDTWRTGCPMQGPPVRLDAKGRVLYSWMCRGRAFWTFSEDGKSFHEPIPVPDKGMSQGNHWHPTIVANAKGEVLFVWAQANEIRWALYNPDGTWTEQRGVAGKQADNNKPTAVAGPDGHFYVVW
jgi:hypothetical protein